MAKLPQYQLVISIKTLIHLTLFILGVYLVFALKDVIFALFISVLLTMAINPYVTKLEHKGVRRTLAIVLIYSLVLITIILLGLALIPPFIRELYSLVQTITIPPILTKSFLHLDYSLQDLEVIFNQLKGLPKIVDAVSGFFSALVIMVTFGVVTFYLLVERPRLHKYLTWFMGQSKDEKKAENFVNSLELQIGSWVRGEAILMLVIGTLTYISLTILQLPYALPLAILAGLFEIIPNIGPTLSLVPALIVAYTNGSLVLTLIVGIVYVLIQQIENNFVVPTVMRRAAGLNPLITILVMIIGLRLGGFLGAFIAVPAFLFAKVLAQEIYKLRLPKDL